MIHHAVKQNSDEWHELRLGVPTASEFLKIVTPKGKFSESSAAYMNWLLAEWLTGCQLDSVETSYMQRGHEQEPFAVKSYEFETGRDVEVAGFITTDDGMIGCSPDRLVGADGLLEIKSPSLQVHVGYMRMRNVDEKYWPQVQGQLWVAEREWLDIQSYSPGLPSVIIRVTRNEEYIARLSEGVRRFVDLMLEARADLETRYGKMERPKIERGEDFMTDEEAEAFIASRFPAA